MDIAKRRASQRRHYENNKDLYIARARARKCKNREMIQTYILEHLRAHPCVDCGNDDPIVLEFDHRPDQQKRFNIADAARNGYGLETIKREIAKCDVRCANCHRKITYHRQGRCDKG